MTNKDPKSGQEPEQADPLSATAMFLNAYEAEKKPADPFGPKAPAQPAPPIARAPERPAQAVTPAPGAGAGAGAGQGDGRGAGGGMGSVSRRVVEQLLGHGEAVRAMVHRDDSRADALRALGAEVFVGDLTNPVDVGAAMFGRMFNTGQSCVAAMTSGRILIGMPPTWKIVSGWDRS